MAARSLGPATIRISALLLFWFNGVVLADSPPPLQSEMQLGFSGRTRRDFLDTVKRVGVLPVRMSEYLGEHPEAGQIAQESVTKYLRVAGFDVAAPDYFNETYELLNREAGGVYSSQTGAPRREVAAAVFGRAIEAYIARERLDGFVTVSIVERSGEFAGERVSWDNVEDLSTGSESGDLSYQIQGKLPVVSLAIEIYDAVGKRMFSRAGGIQPAVYVQDEIFVNVAPADLLKDAARLDRAARSATLPLIYTGRQIADQRYEPQKTGWIQQHTRPLPPAPPPLPQLPALAPLPPAAPFEQTSQLFVAREEILRAVHGAGLAFIDTDALNVPDEVRVRLVRAVLDELSPLQWQVVEAKRAREVMLEYLKGDGLFDPRTGRIDEKRVSGARRAVLDTLGAGPTPDAMLWIALVRRDVVHYEGDVEWDGVNQSGITMGPVVKKLFFGGTAEKQSGAGPIKAVSISVNLVDGSNAPLYRARAGLQLLQKLDVVFGNRWLNDSLTPVNLDPSEWFRDVSREKAAIHLALRQLVLTPDALALEIERESSRDKGKRNRR